MPLHRDAYFFLKGMLKAKAIAHTCNLSTRRGCGQRITKTQVSLNCVVKLSEKAKEYWTQYIKIDFNYLYDNSEENGALYIVQSWEKMPDF